MRHLGELANNMFGTWRKITAILILSWAAVEICVPNVCAAENQVNFPSGAPLDAPKTQSIKATQSPVQSNGDCTLFDDDCFCCSTHVAPSPHFSLSGSLMATRLDSFVAETHTEEWTLLLYHPPRN